MRSRYLYQIAFVFAAVALVCPGCVTIQSSQQTGDADLGSFMKSLDECEKDWDICLEGCDSRYAGDELAECRFQCSKDRDACRDKASSETKSLELKQGGTSIEISGSGK